VKVFEVPVGGRKLWKVLVPAAVVIVAALVGGSFYFRSRSAAPATNATPLSEKDTVVLADFDNTTGDVVFDGALKQALAVQLGQSPFINILSDRKVGETLRLMGRQTSTRITPDVARELCVRTGSKAIVLGSISNLGGQFVIGVDAVGCSSGDTLAKEQEEAASKQDVLKALSKAAASLRTKMGESLASVQKFDVPVEATTPSLEALKAYSMGITTGRSKGDAEAIPFMKRAIELDPNFAMAYVGIAVEYSNLGQASLAADYGKKAYDLRDRVSDREKYRISAFYFQFVTGQVEKATEAYELWAKKLPTRHGAARRSRQSLLGTGAIRQIDRGNGRAAEGGTHDRWLWELGRGLHQRQSAQGRPADAPGSTAEKLRRLGASERSLFLGISVRGCGRYGAPGRMGVWPPRRGRCDAQQSRRYSSLLWAARKSSRPIPARRRLSGSGGSQINRGTVARFSSAPRG
jgi:tetratricopeptide (TPR) repeat protein